MTLAFTWQACPLPSLLVVARIDTPFFVSVALSSSLKKPDHQL